MEETNKKTIGSNLFIKIKFIVLMSGILALALISYRAQQIFLQHCPEKLVNYYFIWWLFCVFVGLLLCSILILVYLLLIFLIRKFYHKLTGKEDILDDWFSDLFKNG
jgi:hypothetical protein